MKKTLKNSILRMVVMVIVASMTMSLCSCGKESSSETEPKDVRVSETTRETESDVSNNASEPTSASLEESFTTSETTETTETTAVPDGMYEYTAYGYTFYMPFNLEDYVYTSEAGMGEVFELNRLASDCGWSASYIGEEGNVFNIAYYEYQFSGENGNGRAKFSLSSSQGVSVPMGDEWEFQQLTSFSAFLLKESSEEWYWEDQNSNSEHCGFYFSVSTKPAGTSFFFVRGCYGNVVASWDDIIVMAFTLYNATMQPGVCPLYGTAMYEDGLSDGNVDYSF